MGRERERGERVKNESELQLRGHVNIYSKALWVSSDSKAALHAVVLGNKNPVNLSDNSGDLLIPALDKGFLLSRTGWL